MLAVKLTQKPDIAGRTEQVDWIAGSCRLDCVEQAGKTWRHRCPAPS